MEENITICFKSWSAVQNAVNYKKFLIGYGIRAIRLLWQPWSAFALILRKCFVCFIALCGTRIKSGVFTAIDDRSVTCNSVPHGVPHDFTEETHLKSHMAPHMQSTIFFFWFFSFSFSCLPCHGYDFNLTDHTAVLRGCPREIPYNWHE